MLSLIYCGLRILLTYGVTLMKASEYKYFGGRPEGKRPLGRTGRR
jgi:hypothetical protein